MSKVFKEISSEIYSVNPYLMDFDFASYRTGNLMIVGYSNAKKELLVQMNNLKQYLYKDVPFEIWEKLKTWVHPQAIYANEVKGFFRFEEVSYLIKEECIDSLIVEYNRLLHFKESSVGLMCTDRPDLIKDEQGILFELKYPRN